MRGLTVALAFSALLAVSAVPGAANASDFWDEVKTPGLRTYLRHVREARRAAAASNWTNVLAEADAAAAEIDHRPEAHVLRGRALGELGRLPEAVAALRRAVELDPRALDTPADGAHAARIAASAHAYDLASEVLPRVLGGMPPSAERGDLYALLGDVLLTRGPDHVHAAISAYREAVRYGSRGGTQAAIGLALALRRAGEDRESSDLARESAARGRVEALVASIPVPEPERAARRAVALESVGDGAGAFQAWEDALQWDPWRAFTLRELGREAEPEEPAP